MTLRSFTRRRLFGKTPEMAGAALVVGMLSLLVAFFPIEESNDAWWHLKAGKLLSEGKLGWSSTDPFTWTGRDKVWINHEWLSEWLFYRAYVLGGLLGAIGFKSGIVALTFGIVFLSCRKLRGTNGFRESNPAAPLLAVCLAIPTSQFTLYLRPPVFTFLMVALFHGALVGREGKAPGWGKTLAGGGLLILWANLHGGAILGCIIPFLMFAGSVADSISSRNHPIREGETWKWGRTFVVLALASLVNPYGYHLHLLTFEMMSHRWLTSRIPEMAPPPFDLIWTIPLLLLPAAVGIVKKGSWGERFLFLFFLWQGLSHVRHLPLLAVWAAPYASAGLETGIRKIPRTIALSIPVLPILIALLYRLAPWSFTVLGIPLLRFVVVAGITAVTAWFLIRNVPLSRDFYLLLVGAAIGFVIVIPGNRPAKFLRAVSGTAWSGRNYPDQIVNLILEHGLPGPVLLCRDNYSGYIIWKLSPERLKTFTCTRYDLQGKIPRMELESMLWCVEQGWKDPDSGVEIPGWEELWEKKYRFNMVLLEKYSDRFRKTPFPLWDYLNRMESGFLPVASEEWPGQRFEDQEFTLFLRRGVHLEHLMKKIRKRIHFREGTG